MIPSSHAYETAQSDVDEMIQESQDEPDEEEPYFQYSWFGLTYSYSKAGYWGRIMLVIILFIPILAALVSEGDGGLALLMLLILAGGLGVSLLMLNNYRK